MTEEHLMLHFTANGDFDSGRKQLLVLDRARVLRVRHWWAPVRRRALEPVLLPARL